jgi:sec-independent protein translocase protein TatB
MFDVGFWELALIFVVALVVVGPERMPQLIRTTGQWLGRAQRVARELRAEFEREAQSQEYKKLNNEFMEEDRRLKEALRQQAQTGQGLMPPPVLGPDGAVQSEGVSPAAPATVAAAAHAEPGHTEPAHAEPMPSASATTTPPPAAAGPVASDHKV